MRLLPDNRAQSIQIGAVLLFGVLIVLLATWQAFVIPDQNEEVEFNHNEDLQQQMTDLRSTTNSMPNTLSSRSVTLDLGMRYPTRTIFRNPSPVSGTIETVGTDDDAFDITITNATTDEENVGDFWDGSDRSYGTGAVEYRPNYNLYNNAPETVYEHSVLFNRFPVEETTLPRTGQALVRDDRITVVAIDGDLQEERVESTSLDIEPISTDTRNVEIEADDGPVTLELVTELREERWNNTLRNEQNVDKVSTSELPDTDRKLLEVTLEEDEEYTLQMAKVGFGTGAEPTEKTYLTDIEGNESNLRTEESQRLTVEVRDRFNNPKRNVDVDAEAEAGEFRGGTNTATRESNSDGQATFRYTAPDNPGDVDIDFSIDDLADFDRSDPENVRMTVSVTEVDAENPSTYDFTFDLEESVIRSSGVREEDGELVLNVDANDEVKLVTATSNPSVSDAKVDYSIRTGDVESSLNSAFVTTADDGTAVDTFTVDNPDEINVADDESEVHASSGGNADKVTVGYEEGAFFDVLIENINSPVTEGETVTAEIEVENTGSEEDTQDIEFEIRDENGNVVFSDEESGVTLDAGDTDDTIEFQWDTGDGDAGEYDAVVSSDDDLDSRDVTVESDDPDGTLSIDDFNDEFPDEQAGHDYGDVTITVNEEDDIELDGEEVTLQIVGDEEGEVFSETIDDQIIPAGGSNDFEFSVGTIDEADSYTATVTADADNADEVTESSTFIVDGTPPQITPVDPEDGNITADNQQLIEATIEDDNTGVDEDSISVDVRDDEGDVFEDATISDDGIDFDGTTLTIDITGIDENEEYADGDVIVDVTAEDNVGNQADEDWTFTVDTTPPEFSNFSPEDGDEVTDRQVPVEVDISDETSGVEEDSIEVTIENDGETVFENTGTENAGISYDGETLSVDITDDELGDREEFELGSVEVTVTAEDRAGNEATTDEAEDIEDEWAFEMSERIEVQDASGTQDGMVEFTLAATSDVEITGIGFDDSSRQNVDKIDNDDQAEFFGDEDYLDTDSIERDEDPTPLDTSAKINEDQSEDFTLLEFRQSNPEQNRNMDGETVTLSLEFSDGSDTQITLNT